MAYFFRFRLIAGLTVLFAVALAPRPIRASSITFIGSPITADGYTFTNFDFSPLNGATGSNVNGLSNNGQVVGVTIGGLTTTSFSGVPPTLSQLNTAAGQMAFGINKAGDVVGGNGTNAFFLPHGGSPTNLTTPGNAINAFGINDNGNIVGQFTSGPDTPGFILDSAASSTFTTINAPNGPDIVNAQSINNNGLVVGFYVGGDGQDHGFSANKPGSPGTITGTAIADPTIPPVSGEPGATFVFSQLLSVNDNGLAVGYYGDSTTSQHGYFYNTNTGKYVFLDDPAEAFDNGVEVTQITGISNTGEIAGFYSDANGNFHSFDATPVPEPGSLFLLCFGLSAIALSYFRRRRKMHAA